MKYNIAIFGATGVVGRKVIKIIEEKNLTDNFFTLFASKKSAGKKLKIGENKFIVNQITPEKLIQSHFDYALFCTTEDISKLYVKKLSAKGTVVIDFSSLYRKKYPLIVPEINFDKTYGKIICNPNCSTIASVMALYKINQKFGLKRIIYSTYQAVSGAGKHALDDLKVTDPKKLKKLDDIIKNNLFAYIGSTADNGYTKEENKMIFETKKILSLKDTKITATCVRVPIEVCHSVSINFQTKKRASLEQIKQCLMQSEGVVYTENNLELMPLKVKDQNNVYVGRLRKDEYKNSTFNIFVVSDNLRKGAAQNGVQILEKLIGEKNNV